MKRADYISLAVMAVIIALGIFFYLRRRNPNELGADFSLAGDRAKPEERGQSNCEKRLKKGVKGEEVRILQEWINREIEEAKYRIKEDGIFGQKTESALRQIGLEVYGHVITSTSLSEIPALKEHCI